MIVIALLLLAAAAAVTVSVILENGEAQTLEMFGVNIEANTAGIFLLGMATMLAIALGLYLLKLVAAKSRRRRHEVKSLKQDKQTEVSRLEAERAQLASDKARLEEEVARRDAEARRSAAAAPVAATPATAGSGATGVAAGEGHRSMFDKATGRHSDDPTPPSTTEDSTRRIERI